jgi:hypothetical protein
LRQNRKILLFEESKPNVKRFYHLDYYYFLFFLLDIGKLTFDDLFTGIIQHEKDLRDLARSVDSVEKFKTDYQIKSTIEEARMFRLINISQLERIELTETGKEFVTLLKRRDYFEMEVVLCRAMEGCYGVLSQIVTQLYNANPKGHGLVIFPRPSPKALDFSPRDLINGSKLNDYCKSCAEYSVREVRKNMFKEIDENSIHNRLITSLRGYLGRMENSKQSINLPREVKKIMYSYYIDLFWPDKYDVTSFDIWIRRAKEFKLINFTEFFPGHKSLIIYPISIFKSKSAEVDMMSY